MSKQTRKQKKEEEARIVAEMEDALKKGSETEEGVSEGTASSESASDETASGGEGRSEKKRRGDIFDAAPERVHCRRCKTLMGEDGVCPTCGFRMYVPMDKQKRDKIKLIGTVVLMAVFVVLFVVLQIMKG